MSVELKNFNNAFEQLTAKQPSALHAEQKAAFERFLAIGLPNRRVEAWKYTDVSGLHTQNFNIAARAPNIDAAKFASVIIDKQATAFIFIDGHYAPAHSLHTAARGVDFAPLATHQAPLQNLFADEASNAAPFSLLHQSFAQDGTTLRIAKDTAPATPIYIYYISTTDNVLTAPHTHIVIEAGAKASIVEVYASVDNITYLTNANTQLHLHENASLQHHRLQQESEHATHISQVTVEQARGSAFHNLQYDNGSALARTDLQVNLSGSGAACYLHGLYRSNDKQHHDNQVRVSHHVSDCHSEQHYKGLINDQATAVLNGCIHVHPQAQKTTAKQINNNLLLSPRAEINTKPQLEIYADDVKCNHGATVGQLDETALFYLQSRGLSHDEAKGLLTDAFAGEIIAPIGIEALRDYLTK